ncbi:hypothetical protein [Streptomyces sp. NBC_00201]|uniref:hypothetical protein n=1 Tax=Streptomyces sp. NBC_00201 TaxID=2975679 RepID=UPI002259D63F|nr:hypothetical protein [Streptomyces sp. NBC_00201]
MTVGAVNTTGTALTPHFASRVGQGASNGWIITSGPTTLAPHSTAEYVVRPAGGHRALPGGRRSPQGTHPQRLVERHGGARRPGHRPAP